LETKALLQRNFHRKQHEQKRFNNETDEEILSSHSVVCYCVNFVFTVVMKRRKSFFSLFLFPSLHFFNRYAIQLWGDSIKRSEEHFNFVLFNAVFFHFLFISVYYFCLILKSEKNKVTFLQIHFWIETGLNCKIQNWSWTKISNF
jgi:hypothetical protein